MKPLRILCANAAVLLLIVAIVIIYSAGTLRSYRTAARASVEKNAQEIQEVARTYMLGEQNVCDSWASYINASSMTMEEATSFVRASCTDERITAHLLWADSFSGLSTAPMAGTANGYQVVYQSYYSAATSEYTYSNLDALAGLDFAKEPVHITVSYTNPMDGAKVISFASELTLMDSGTPREAILLRVVPMSYLQSNWVFAADYTGSSVALIEPSGAFIIKPSVMKNNNFFEFIYSYNKGSIDTDALRQSMSGSHSGSFFADNAKGERMLFAYAGVESADGWMVVLTMPEASAFSNAPNSILAWWIFGALAVVMLLNVLYFNFTNKREREARKVMAEQMETITRQSEELQTALDAAQHANRAKTTFLNNMSHDIRTPMNAIIGFTSLAATHIDNTEQVKEYLKKIQVSSNHLLSLINDVLDMSRIESGKVKIEEKEVHLPDILHDLRTIVQSDVKAHQLDFTIDTMDVKDEEIICDKLRLNQVLLNIVSNAIKYTRPGGHIGVKITQHPGAPEGYAAYSFSVRDTGIGMSEEFLKHIYEPFTREQTATVSGIQGSGLGLAITKNIVDMMGGTISVKSQEGVGTEFTVDFSFRKGTKQAEVCVVPELSGAAALVVDDATDCCISVSKMLTEIGMRPEWTTSGREAVVRTQYACDRGDSFAVYIIDWLMPDMNGVETVRRIRRIIGDQKPIIVLTAYDWGDMEAEAREAGVTHFISKPIFMSELRGILSQPFTVRTEEEPKAEMPDFAGKRILLVEDNALNREIAIDILQEAGFSVETAEDGSVAVEMLRKMEEPAYDLILMDIQMPIMDGHEATRQIRKLPNACSRLPIVAMTANAFDEDKKQAFAAGMNGHVAKPINVDNLMQTLSKVLQLS